MLITAWGFPAKERDQLLKELSTDSAGGLWDRPIPEVPGDVGTLATYEAEASEIVTISTGVVPGLLQTRETAHALLTSEGLTTADAERHWLERKQRQQHLMKIDYTVYFSESVLFTLWGGRPAHRAQLAQLLRCDEIGLSQIRIVPRDQNRVALLHTWHWLGFPNMPPVVHVELVAGAVYVHETERFASKLRRLDHVALPREESRTMIRRLMERL